MDPSLNHWKGLSLKERLDAQIIIDGVCLIWVGTLSNKGYGRVKLGKLTCMAHRVMYEMYIGQIPPGLQIDHLCRRRACVNPAHLEPVTPKENSVRGNTGINQVMKEHCPQGHLYNPENIYWIKGKNGEERRCKTCANAQYKKRYDAGLYDYRFKKQLSFKEAV